MPTVIDESAEDFPERGVEISVPIGSDTRTAASLLDAWTAIAKRLSFLEAFYDLAKALTLGGTLAPAGSLVVDLTDATVAEGLEFTATGLRKVFFSGDAVLFPNRKIVGPLFTAGGDGRANKKCQRVSTGANFAFNALNYDTLLCTPSASINVTLSAVTYELDDSFTVLNLASSTHAITVKEPGGSTLLAVQPQGRCEFVFNGATWDVFPFATIV